MGNIEQTKTGLDIMGIPTLLQSIADERKTGNLKIQSTVGEKYIFFRGGNIVQVSSSQNPSILAEGLRRHPEIDEESYNALCEQQKRTGQSLAALLLSDENEGLALVNAICRFQILEEICELFTWEDAHAEFTGPDPDPMLFDLELMNIEPMQTSMVLLEAARRIDEWRYTLQILSSKKDIPYKANSIPEESRSEIKVIYEAVDGFKNIEEIVASVRLSIFAAMNALAEMIKNEILGLKNAKELLQLARLDILRENITKRIQLYERALELGEKSPDITLWLAHSYRSMGMKDKASKQYEDLGHFYLQSNKWRQAAEAFSIVAELAPENLDAHERLITLLSYLGNLKEYAEKVHVYALRLALQGQQKRGILILQEAIEKYPCHLQNLDLLGNLYQETGMKAQAIQVYQALAQLEFQEQKNDAAAQTYLKITQIAPDNLESRKNLGQLLEKLGRIKDAVEQYRSIGKIVTNIGEINAELGAYLGFAAKQIIQYDANELVAYQWLAKAYLAENKTQDAIFQLQAILSKLEEKKNLDLLVETLKTLVQLQPTSLEYRFKLAETYLKINKEREAVQEYFALGMAAIECKRLQEALEAFNALLNFDPAHYATHLKKAELLLKEDRNEEAMQELMLTGHLSLGADKLWQAVKAFGEVIRIDRDAHVGCYLELGNVYHKLGKIKEAVAAYKKHVQKSVKANNFGEALRSCEKILSLEPANEWAQTAQQKITGLIPKIGQVFQTVEAAS